MSFFSQINIFTCLFFPPEKLHFAFFRQLGSLCHLQQGRPNAWLVLTLREQEGARAQVVSSMPHPVSSCTEKTGYVPASITIILYIYFGSYAALITMTTACPNYQTYAEAVWLSWQQWSKSGDQRKESPGWTPQNALHTSAHLTRKVSGNRSAFPTDVIPLQHWVPVAISKSWATVTAKHFQRFCAALVRLITMTRMTHGISSLQNVLENMGAGQDQGLLTVIRNREVPYIRSHPDL